MQNVSPHSPLFTKKPRGSAHSSSRFSGTVPNARKIVASAKFSTFGSARALERQRANMGRPMPVALSEVHS
jgi:hypothetical protein